MSVYVCESVSASKWLSLLVFFFSMTSQVCMATKGKMCVGFIKAMYYLLSGLGESSYCIFNCYFS